MPVRPARVHVPAAHGAQEHGPGFLFTDQPSAMDLNKPLPQVPEPGRSGQRVHWERTPPSTRSGQPELGSDSSPSVRAKRSGLPRKKINKNTISRPLLQVSSSSSGIDSVAGYTSEEHSPMNGRQPRHPLSSRAAVEDLGRKLEGLMGQRDSSPAASGKDASGSASSDGKCTPRRRSKAVLGRVRLALRDCPLYSLQNRGGPVASVEPANGSVMAMDAAPRMPAEAMVLADMASRKPRGPFLIPRKPVGPREDTPPQTSQDGDDALQHGNRHDPSMPAAHARYIPQLRLHTADSAVYPDSVLGGDEETSELMTAQAGSSADAAAMREYPGIALGYPVQAGEVSRPSRVHALSSDERVHSAAPISSSKLQVSGRHASSLLRMSADTGTMFGSYDAETRSIIYRNLQQPVTDAPADGVFELKRKNSQQQRSASECPVLRKKFKDEHLGFI